MKYMKKIGLGIFCAGMLTLAACSSKADDSTENDATGQQTETGPTEEEKKKEFNTMMSDILRLNNMKAYTEVMDGSGSMVFDIHTTTTTMSTNSPYVIKTVYSYNPGEIYYEAETSQEGAKITKTSNLYVKEEGTEYQYYDNEREDDHYCYKLSDGHIDYQGKIDVDVILDDLLLESSQRDSHANYIYYTSFDELGNGMTDMAGQPIESLLESVDSLFVAPEYNFDSNSYTISFNDNNGEHFATITGTIVYKIARATAATSTKCAVTESEYKFNYNFNYYYDATSFKKADLSYSASLSGGDGTNTFNQVYSVDGVITITDTFDSEDIPEKTDSYTKQSKNGYVSLYTLEDCRIGGDDYTSGTVYDFSSFKTNSTVEYGDFYSDKMMTEKVTSFTGKSFNQKYYTTIKAKDVDKALILVSVKKRDTSNGTYGYASSYVWNVYAIDTNGQVEFKTYDIGGKNYTVDSIEVEYTNDLSDSITDGTKLNVKHDNYYAIEICCTLA